jgi:glycosyltransferase involved in cell wall biosynthesis
MKICTIIPNFNSGGILLACLENLVSQEIPEGHEHEIVVVDDGSTDGSADLVAAKFGDSVKLIRIDINSGRSFARNKGAELSDSEFVHFVDSDCIPKDNFYIRALITTIENGNDLVFGAVTTNGRGFWDLLQIHGSAARLVEFNRGRKWVFTTSNVCIRTSHFKAVGGFDMRFNRHGFEDRDVFIRLIHSGARCAYTDCAAVIHCDKISLCSVSKKMLDTGRNSAREFEALHPVEYREMPYSRIDCNLIPKLRYVDTLTWPIARRLAKMDIGLLELEILPFRLRSLAAQVIYGLHYLHGTAEALKSMPR